ncbi:peptidase inhibitor family I36 protein [Phytoactinopolyspora alkaliphila]|uniref:Peptidase inhibitor family I36 protein n=1 Tax=Phytoactinopolyspora alkaliphila TaxID=1783498 RepID=A0A6N9YSR9_9ACTN|nr:peptidase inhibitor family I36 protein [Phytoactinopolyspora alkaliphila]NED98081.1 peptidase inhibitor family I36 protein [Phytoactinopolyspora alkaliphila]
MFAKLGALGRRGALMTAGVAAVLLAPMVAWPAASAGTAEQELPTGPVADQMIELLKLQPGGVQVSDNALAWEDGATVVVWPSPGEEAAPAGLGENVRADVVESLDSALLAEQSGSGQGFSAMGSYTSCPSSYYCFYTSSNYDGTRYQFSSTCTGSASSWGFNNQTSSWANRSGSKKIIYAYDYNGGPLLWHEPHPSQNSYVGSSDNNRMSYWRCSHTQ